MIVVLDGPEKAGKSTLARALVDELGFRHRPWNAPFDQDPTPLWAGYGRLPQKTRGLLALVVDLESDGHVVWDRSWLSEVVYGTLLFERRRVAEDPWLGRWLYDRPLEGRAQKFVLLGPSAERATYLRTADDQPVDPSDERDMYANIGKEWGWLVVHNDHAPLSTHGLVELVRVLTEHKGRNYPAPSRYVGPRFAPVVVVGDRLSDTVSKLAPFPWSSEGPVRFARSLGDDAFACGWTNAEADPFEEVARARLVVACGEVAHRYTRLHAKGLVLALPHPAWLYRWRLGRGRVEDVEGRFREAVRIALSCGS